jgi:hypothetical protein
MTRQLVLKRNGGRSKPEKWRRMKRPSYSPFLPMEKRKRRFTSSIAGRIGHAMEPIVKPMGFDWGVDLLLLVPKLQLGNTTVQKLELR